MKVAKKAFIDLKLSGISHSEEAGSVELFIGPDRVCNHWTISPSMSHPRPCKILRPNVLGLITIQWKTTFFSTTVLTAIVAGRSNALVRLSLDAAITVFSVHARLTPSATHGRLA
jgi:hypothetical protein